MPSCLTTWPSAPSATSGRQRIPTPAWCPSLLQAGCQRSSAKVSLRFWAMGREGEVAQELLQGFRGEHPDWELRIEQLPWSAAHEKFLTAFAGDATPDVAQMGNTWLPEMAALGALQPLAGRLAAATTVPQADYFEGLWRTNVIAGQLLGLPWTVDTRLLYYRADLLAQAGFSRAPQDWPQWQAAMQALQQRAGVATPQLFPLTEFEPLLALALQAPGELVSAEGRAHFRGPAFRQALGFYLEAFRRGWAPAATHNQIANVWQEFDRGSIAFYISGPWNIAEFRRRLAADRQHIWAAAPLPGPQGPGASIAGGTSLVMFKRSRHPEAAWALMEYLARPAVQARFFQLSGNLPPRRSVWELAGLQQDPAARAFAAQLERVRPTPALPEWERIAQEMQLTAAHLAYRGGSVDAALAQLDQRVDALLSKRRWMLARQAGSLP
ncbi:MAG: ABC transporter substrate-binding protein [Ideonella sp. MAG2]|nr:MAG: ABC transporter substrate-binding protein [Ideonella sp. MAG2]